MTSLSDNIKKMYNETFNKYLVVEDVRAFIKELKKELYAVEDPCEFDCTGFDDIIDELAGEKLI